MTLPELEERLKTFDEITLLERLNISSDDIVERFGDVIEREFESFENEFMAEEDDLTKEKNE